MSVAVWLVFVAAAILEVGGDTVVRRGLREGNVGWILLRGAALACYGLVGNSVKWDFSTLLGVYVGFFALGSILFGRFILRETISRSTWSGWRSSSLVAWSFNLAAAFRAFLITHGGFATA
jgi:drug/metabolite transporter superfamily protein YnfA